MEQDQQPKPPAAQPRNIASVTKISREEIDQILQDAIERDSKYFRLPDRPNGRHGRSRPQPTS